MTSRQMRELAESTMSVVGIIQGFYKSFLKENDGDKDVALALTEIAWNGLTSIKMDDNNNYLM